MSENRIDYRRRRFLTQVTTGVGLVGVVGAATPFVMSMNPSERAKAAGAPVEVDLTKVQPGQLLKVEWRGKAVYVVRRTQDMLTTLSESKLVDVLADPSSEESIQPEYAQNSDRSSNPEYLIVEGVCTHFGCAPLARFEVGPDSGLGDDWVGGFFCPCHGSKFDLAGRVYQGVPAPTNLTVPPYHFVDDTHVMIGEDPEEA